jgi:hypothetical protein
MFPHIVYCTIRQIIQLGHHRLSPSIQQQQVLTPIRPYWITTSKYRFYIARKVTSKGWCITFWFTKVRLVYSYIGIVRLLKFMKCQQFFLVKHNICQIIAVSVFFKQGFNIYLRLNIAVLLRLLFLLISFWNFLQRLRVSTLTKIRSFILLLNFPYIKTPSFIYIKIAVILDFISFTCNFLLTAIFFLKHSKTLIISDMSHQIVRVLQYYLPINTIHKERLGSALYLYNVFDRCRRVLLHPVLQRRVDEQLIIAYSDLRRVRLANGFKGTRKSHNTN